MKIFKNPYSIPLIGLLVLIVIGGAEAFEWRRASKLALVTPTPSVSPSPSNSAVPTAPNVSPTITVAPVPTNSPQASGGLDSLSNRVVSDFYTAYAAKNRSKLATMFTPDTTPELASLHARLFTGIDTNGNPGGPTLFSSNSAVQVASTYSIISSTVKGNDWVVTVNEQRLDGNGATVGNVTTVLTLAPVSSGWLIDSYVYSGGAGKYDGFISN